MLADHARFLEHAFDILNATYFEKKLPKVVITIQTSPRSYGYITTQKVWGDKDGIESFYEINISAEHLSRPIENVCATLLHEMVHLYCMCEKIQDTSNNGRYHNKKFKAEAEKRNLIIEHAKYIGWSVTTPSDEFVTMLKNNGLLKNIEHSRNTKALLISPKGKRKSSTRKYICPTCKASVRATKDINIIHADCGVLMVKVD